MDSSAASVREFISFGRGRYGGWFFNVGRFGVRLYRVTLEPHRGAGLHLFWKERSDAEV